MPNESLLAVEAVRGLLEVTTNLSAVEKEIRVAIGTWNQQRIEMFLQQRDIQWNFNPQELHIWDGLGASDSVCTKGSQMLD